MYSLNNYAQKSNLFFKEKQILYRGAKTNYINLLPFERLKGKKILLTSFTSSSESLSVANIFSGREKAKEIFKEYSVIMVLEQSFFDQNWSYSNSTKIGRKK